MNKEINDAVKAVDSQLKPFQAASVKYVIKQLFQFKRSKVLIADEVGLGKTIVAKGVIAKAIQKQHHGERPFHVVYICSNQVLAQQNIIKLNPFKTASNQINRIVFLAYKSQKIKNSPIQLSSLTPSTSFNLTKSVGLKEERAMIYSLLITYSDFKKEKDVLKKMLKGNHQIREDNWHNLIIQYEQKGIEVFRKGLPRDFKKQLESISFNEKDFVEMKAYLGNRDYSSFYSAFIALLKKLSKNNDRQAIDFAYKIIRFLRKELTKVCVRFLNADLFILDEFQRFKTLLDSEEISEANEIAQVVLQDKEAKVLLLSATPFKPYTTQLEQLQGEDHHTEFKRIITFLGGEKGKSLWKSFRKDQQAFFDILRHPEQVIQNNEEALAKKSDLEKSFKKFISRNERMAIAKNYDNMVSTAKGTNLVIIKNDIENFIAIDRTVQEIAKINPRLNNRFGSTIEFSKSAPYPLSYLQGYKLRENLDMYKDELGLKEFFKKNTSSWLPYEAINNYKAVGYHNDVPSYPNPKLRLLAQECFKDKAEFLLWVPPSKGLYKPFGIYKDTDDFSKILIFSGWAMVPRAVSTLLSYEIERRTIGSELLSDLKEKERRSYFSDKPKPRPVLNYSTVEGKVSQMSNLILIYPFRFIGISAYEDNEFEFDKSFSSIRSLQEKKLKAVFRDFSIRKIYCKLKRKDDRWYWLAPILIDYLNEDKSFQFLDRYILKFKGSKKEHFQNARDTIAGLEKGAIKLGEFPLDLFKILATSVLASPANASLFSLRKLFKDTLDLEGESLKIAEAFRSHFNKPESISAIRISATGKEYWRQVLNYCASGNIAAMMSEFLYLIKEADNYQEIKPLTEYLENILTTRSSNIQVDLQNNQGEILTQNMRCHFAISYGTQKLSTESGKDRAVNIRSVFNSPFRPFVLTSTSIGQEGLDFHFYCRKIYHWNLPHNAIDLEQREGRINRFKSFVIRKKIAELIKNDELYSYCKDTSLWDKLFTEAEKKYSNENSGISPYWYLEEGALKIDRFVPMTSFSKDIFKYEQLKTTLGLYRLTFGQPRQEELVEALKNSGLNDNEMLALRDNLLINLSPLKLTKKNSTTK
ncbi:hypothetical protein QO206_05700 [Leeuwenhoekiella aequorea]|uniref:hypothetical protein n=1 Tax=Leeuwenhoekiella aequorea TaxID=283736 RepID=UPI00352DA0E8